MITPKIHEDGGVNDFASNCSYHVKVSYNPAMGYIYVDNRLVNMDWLIEATESDNATWTAEIVVPRALLSHRAEGNSSSRVSFDWDENYNHHPTYVRSALVAKQDFPISKKNLSDAWQLSHVPTTITISAGNIIARSAVHAISGRISQFLAFKTDPGTLPKNSRQASQGLMKVIDSGRDPLMYYAIVSEDVFQTKETDRNLWVTALSRVLAIISREEDSWSNPKYDSIKQTLKNELREDMPSWNDPEFDPLLVATRWEPFRPAQKGESDEQDD